MSRISVNFSNTFANEPTVRVPVSTGTPLASFLETQGGVPDGAKVRLNRQDVDEFDDTELQDRDVVSITPSQIKGA